jgi:hypothetical protein
VKFNGATALLTLAGAPLLTPDKSPATLGGISAEALVMTFGDEPTLSGEEKRKRYRFAHRISRSVVPLDLTPEEVVLLRGLVAKAYGPLVVGQVWDLLEGTTPEGTEAK